MHRADHLDLALAFAEILLEQVAPADRRVRAIRRGFFEMRVDAGPQIPQVDMRIDNLQRCHHASPGVGASLRSSPSDLSAAQSASGMSCRTVATLRVG